MIDLYYPFAFISGLAVSTLPSLRFPKTLNSVPPPLYQGSRYLLREMSCVPVIRQRRASSIEISTINQNGVMNSKTRRKSLPALGVPNRVRVIYTLFFLRFSRIKVRRKVTPINFPQDYNIVKVILSKLDSKLNTLVRRESDETCCHHTRSGMRTFHGFSFSLYKTLDPGL